MVATTCIVNTERATPAAGPVRLIERGERQAAQLGHRLGRGGERTADENHEADDEEQDREVEKVDR